ncbi:unnamed protein product [Chrysoparadoxa australica]
MLAHPEKKFSDVLNRLNGKRFTCEYKYDGERAQIHLVKGAEKGQGTLKIFSRSSEDNSSKYPELLAVCKSAAKEGVEDFVLDSEVIAFDVEKGTLQPFQVLSTRKRKDENEADIKVRVIVAAFDLLYLNGRSLLDETLSERRKLMKENFEEVENKFQFAVSKDFMEDGDSAPIETFLDEAVKASCEGLMVKTLDVNATYQPEKRSLNWLKLKKDYIAEAGGACDSLDLVPIGAYYGKGKRAGVFGCYLMASYDPDTDGFQTVCKLGTGFKDEDLQSLTEKMKACTLDTQLKPTQYDVDKDLAKDIIWLEVDNCWELKGADLSKSPVHRAAIGKAGASVGISIRFPRFIRERLDKKATQATTGDQILRMYNAQDVVVSNAAPSTAAADDSDEDIL